ncbi:MAG: response regulator [Verrucomicrobiae bacterium]|nr:response regulator [Verrucomicrobiae bacterium]
MNRILIAAGDPTTAEGTQTALSSAGFQTAVVSDCQQLLAFCGQHTPDLVVMDFDMDGNGIWTAAQALRTEPRLASMPLVGIASHLSDAERQHAQSIGFSAVVDKPVSVESLVKTVRAAFSATEASNVTQMPQTPSATPQVHDPVGILVKQINEIRQLTAELKPNVSAFGEEAPELFEYIENSGTQIHEELAKISAHGVEHSAIALQDKDLRHDFRNMIGSVTGFSELLLMEPSVQGASKEKFTRIRVICREFCNILDEQKAVAA